MTELKTLKDLKDDYVVKPDVGDEIYINNIVKVQKLKQEAIKRYKFYFAQAMLFDRQDLDKDKQFCLGICCEIKEFNNLTEEDLK